MNQGRRREINKAIGGGSKRRWTVGAHGASVIACQVLKDGAVLFVDALHFIDVLGNYKWSDNKR